MLIVVPSVQSLSQWYSLLGNAFRTEIGVYFHSEKRVRPLTVATWDASRELMAEHGDSFEALICDEVQRVLTQIWKEVVSMAPAPLRLGLTSIPPEEQERRGEEWQTDDLIGPTVYTLRLETLSAKQRAAYRTQRVLVDLTDEECTSYNAAYEAWRGYVREQGLQRSHGAAWVQELKRRSIVDADARRAWLSRRQALKLLEGCQGKFAAFEALLREYTGERMLVFTGSSEVAYNLSRQYLVPTISHATEPAERKYILDAYEAGQYTVVVTTEPLKEVTRGPEAKIAVVFGGGSRKQEYFQHLEYSLRKKAPVQALLIEVLARDTIEEGEIIE